MARVVETLAEGIYLGESPRWHEGRLWFADWVAEKLFTLGEGGEKRLEASIASLPFSIDWLPDGRLLVVNAPRNLLERREADGTFAVHADLSNLSERGCNEIVVAPNGDIYVNNIDFEFPGGEFRPGFIALVRDGVGRRVAEGLAFPNGMAITPDGRTLICGESYSKRLTAYAIQPDGTLSDGRVWAQFEDGGPDGICLDAEGAIWTSLGPRAVRVRDGGEIIERIELDRFCFATMLGGEDGRTLFMMAADWPGAIAGPDSAPTGRIYAARIDVPHAGYP